MALSSKPISSLNEDLFHSLPLIRRITSGLSRIYEPVSIGAIFASQGSGRTSLLNLCRSFAESDPLTIDHKITFWIPPFESWKLAGIGNLTTALLWHIHRSLPEVAARDEKVLYKLGRISVALSALSSPSLSSCPNGTSEPSRNMEIINKTLPPERKSQVSSIFSAYEQIDELAGTFQNFGKKICELCGFDTIVTPIDDLDKCSPEQTVSLLIALRTLIRCDSFSFLIAADRDILARHLNASNYLSRKQALNGILTFFDDWITIPVPPLRNVLKNIDFPVSIKEQFLTSAETVGLTRFVSGCSSVQRACRRFEQFIYGEGVDDSSTIDDYLAWFGWFLIAEDNPSVVNALATHYNVEHLFRELREGAVKSIKTAGRSRKEVSSRISFDTRPIAQSKDVPSAAKTLVNPDSSVMRYLECMFSRMSDQNLAKRLKEVIPFI